MQAAVYQGAGVVSVQPVPTPQIGPGEILIRVESCGICHTDLKKIEYNLLPPPRIYGHETAGVVAKTGEGVRNFVPGDRVVVFHHIPCMQCFYCQRKVYAQCATYKKVGVTAGFEPAGGGFAQYVRVMDWIVERGVEKIPDGVSFDQACFVEPVNTCLKAVVQCDPQPGEVVLIMGQGPIGLLFTMLVNRTGARVFATDTLPKRLELARSCGALESWNPRSTDVPAAMAKVSGGRGADLVILAASAPGLVEQAIRASRPGARILLFAQTSDKERIELSGADICMGERRLFGCYSASVDLQKEAAELVFGGRIWVEGLVSHRLPLIKISSGFDMALHPDGQSLKIIVQPQRCS
ncbi:MAG: alcohol dehydrogenase catalytic domain-containing protein [Acidobacteria bacterium]|nr:alcohol dehydrogenase catalytic domain-containing protein [Acidobacteriota bacterium]MBI3473215.1 alcohol dehydrogenase catalytic domain-containing protein [Candidatus Solibacter usitatus]